MLKKFVKRIITLGLSFTLALGSAFGTQPFQKAQAAEANNEDIVFSINAFNNLDYTFPTINGDTISSKVLPDKDVTLLVFGRTTCASTWLTIRNIAESSRIYNANVSVIYIDIDGADAEVVQSSIDYYSRLSEDADSYYRGCGKITFCHDAEDKNEDARKMYHMLSGIRGTIYLPMIVVVDKNDIVREILTHSQAADSILSVMNQVIAKGNAAGEEDDKKDDTETDNAGKDEAGTDNAGEDETGADNTGKDETGTDDTGKDETGTDNTEKVPVVVRLENVYLSQASVSWTGKEQKPSVVAKDSNGKTISSSNYTVTYSNNKNVGQAMVTIIFKNGYTGTVKKTFTILPKGTTLAKLTAKKKGFTVRWKKLVSQTTGYEIQYSTSSKFKGAKTTGNIKAKVTTKYITKLKAKKKYYVRIRTYKTVKIDGKNKKLYSDWSKVKSVTTKK